MACTFVLAIAFELACALAAPAALAANAFLTERGDDGLRSLRRAGDPSALEFIAPGKTLGAVRIRYRSGEGAWNVVSTEGAGAARRTIDDGESRFAAEYGFPGLRVTIRFDPGDAALCWKIALENTGKAPLTVGDLALPLPLFSLYPMVHTEEEKREVFARRVFRHAFISGHASFVYWLPVGGIGPHLVMLPADGHTWLEYFEESGSNYAHGGERYVAYIHSAARGGEISGGTWRQPQTSRVLAPGEVASHAFSLRWADDADGVREALYQEGGVDVHVAPGMVIPEDLSAMFALRTLHRIDAVTAEFQDATRIEALKSPADAFHVYRVSFRRRGENLLTVRYGDGRSMVLEFFVTEPLETLIRKRAAFIAGKQQHRDPSKWYDGLFSLWDARLPAGQNLLGPDHLGGQHPYAVSGSDDPSNSKSILLSEKNVAYPEPREIEALEYFIERFVWGKHQRTDRETPYPYGIYGADSWHQNRFAERDPLEGAVSRPGGPSQCRMWRTFDYTTYFALYYNMYRIARQNPSLVRHLDAKGYLERAYGTARAYFEVPYNIRMEGGWSFTGWTDWAYTIGNFHEKYLLAIMESLEAEGRAAEARHLRGEWEKKVKYFLYDDLFPFISEMPVDSTAYESTYAIAKYALARGLEPDENLWRHKETGRWFSHPRIDPARHSDFLRRQLLANLACRGWLEASYYHLGSDFRGCGSSFYTLSYMSQMGGWAILDQALRFEENPFVLIRLGYASLLSSWALLNTGTAESNHGWWWPGALHDGAAGWGFMPQKVGDDWNPAARGLPRGPWPVDGEIDHGLAAYIETALTVVVDDPIFGRFAYGGTLEAGKDEDIRVVPRDGIRQRLAVLVDGRRLFASLDRDGFARSEPVLVREDFEEIGFALESRSAGLDSVRPGSTDPGPVGPGSMRLHPTMMTIEGLPAGSYGVKVDGEPSGVLEVSGKQPARFSLRAPGESGRMRVAIARNQ